MVGKFGPQELNILKAPKFKIDADTLEIKPFVNDPEKN